MHTKPIALTLLLALAGSAAAGEPAPATTRAAGEVEVVVTKIEPGATLVTGQLNELSPADLFFRLAQEAKVGIVPSDEGLWGEPALQNAKFSAEWQKQPLWEAIAEACEAIGVKPTIDTPQSGVPRIKLERGAVRGPVVVDGPVMIRPARIVRSASVSYADRKRADDQVTLSLDVLLEPKLRKNAWIGAATIEKAQDEQGKPLPATRPSSESRGEIYGRPSVAMLTYPPKAGKKIALLRGAVPLLVASEIATITFHDPFSSPRELKAKIGPHTLTLKPITGDAKSGWQVSLRLDRGDTEKNADGDARWTATSQPLGAFAAYVALIGPKGQTLMNGGSAGAGDREAQTQLRFAPREPGDEPTALRIELPVSFESRKAKFEFKDLPLP